MCWQKVEAKTAPQTRVWVTPSPPSVRAAVVSGVVRSACRLPLCAARAGSDARLVPLLSWFGGAHYTDEDEDEDVGGVVTRRETQRDAGLSCPSVADDEQQQAPHTRRPPACPQSSHWR